MLLPDDETSVDFLNYDAIAEAITLLLEDSRQRALTIGVHGDWGAGKSSVLKMIETKIDDDQSVACLWFNGWTFEGFDDAKTVLIEAIIEELCRQRSHMGKVKELGARLLKRVDWLKLAKRGSGLAFLLATGLPSPDQIETVLKNLTSIGKDAAELTPEQIQAKLEEASTYLKAADDVKVPQEIHQFRQDFIALLEEAKIDQLVVLIDDLDRCLPSTAISTLEAIRLFLFVPKTAFIIGADEAMIEYAVREHFPDLPVASGPMPYARNYLEKLVQVPFRIPALGIEETRTYVSLLMLEGLFGKEHDGFQMLLAKAKQDLNQPWLGKGLSQEDLHAVDSGRVDEINAVSLVAQQIGPILAEGTRGNLRQIKRFLNALLIRQLIATARGFGDQINQSVLAKLMLAERFQPDFYELISSRAMTSGDGTVAELKALEGMIKQPESDSKKNKDKDDNRKKKEERETSSEIDERWLGREWLRQWAKIEPSLSQIDLRPYVFVARDKRVLATSAALTGLEALTEKLCGSELAIRAVEPEVKSLSEIDAETVFSALKDRVLRAGDYTSQPKGFLGLCFLAKHHPHFWSEIWIILSGIEPKGLGVWVLKGWNEYLTDGVDKKPLIDLMNKWANQDENTFLKKAAGSTLPTMRTGGR